MVVLQAPLQDSQVPPLGSEAPPNISQSPPRDSKQLEEIRKQFGRFRILVIGRGNAGKTTILQKVCNTSEQAEIYDQDGRKVLYRSF